MAKPRSPKKTGNTNGADGVATSAAVPGTAMNAPVETASVTSAEPVPAEKEKTTVRKSTRKPEIVKAESRSNLVPINVEDEIRRLAYLLSERRGFEPGHETEDWLNAEHEVLQRYHHPHTASVSA